MHETAMAAKTGSPLLAGKTCRVPEGWRYLSTLLEQIDNNVKYLTKFFKNDIILIQFFDPIEEDESIANTISITEYGGQTPAM